MAETESSIAAATRAILGDPDALMYPDTILLAPLNIAQGELGDELAVNGLDRMRATTTFSNVPANTTVIGPATTPALPANFLAPIQLWEKPTGSAATNYSPIILAREQIPPTLIQGSLNLQYTFFGGNLNFLGATQALDILMDYVASLSPFAAPSDTAPVVDSTRAIAYRAAAIIAETDQPESAGAFNAKYQDSVDKILRLFNRVRQRKPRRPRRYRGSRVRLA